MGVHFVASCGRVEIVMVAELVCDDSRRDRRMTVNWDASATLGDLCMTGTVRNITPNGLFFEAEHACDGALYADPVVSDMAAIGDRLHVSVYGWTRPLVCVVRWVGESGFGCEFARDVDNKLGHMVEKLDRDLKRASTGATVHRLNNVRALLLMSWDGYEAGSVDVIAMIREIDKARDVLVSR